jgi:hypothetical protein
MRASGRSRLASVMLADLHRCRGQNATFITKHAYQSNRVCSDWARSCPRVCCQPAPAVRRGVAHACTWLAADAPRPCNRAVGGVCITVPAGKTWQPLLVNALHDKPQLPTTRKLEKLKANPAVAPFWRLCRSRRGGGRTQAPADIAQQASDGAGISSSECDAGGSAAIVSSALASPAIRLRALAASARHSSSAN